VNDSDRQSDQRGGGAGAGGEVRALPRSAACPAGAPIVEPPVTDVTRVLFVRPTRPVRSSFRMLPRARTVACSKDSERETVMKGFRLGFIRFVLCALALPALGANRMYIKFEGPDIRGGSTAPGHSGEIEVLRWNHGIEMPADPRATGGVGTVEQATHSDFTFVKSFDSATEELMKHAWSGKQIRKVTLTCYRGDDTSVPMLTVVMEKLVISGWKTSRDTNGAGTETISLDYGTIKYTYSGGKQTVE
jgi:type VI secretion system secreted protein Hcp